MKCQYCPTELIGNVCPSCEIHYTDSKMELLERDYKIEDLQNALALKHCDVCNYQANNEYLERQLAAANEKYETAKRSIFCLYCGNGVQVDIDDFEAAKEIVIAHTKICLVHPIGIAERKTEELERQLAEAQKELSAEREKVREAREGIMGMQYQIGLRKDTALCRGCGAESLLINFYNGVINPCSSMCKISALLAKLEVKG
jgi:hypothetical protein